MPWRSHLHPVLRHPREPKILLLRSDRAWRLPRARVQGRVGFANAAAVCAAFERRLGMRPWLLRALQITDDEAARRRVAVHELELTDVRWQEPANGRWVDAGELARLRLAEEPQRELLSEYLVGLDDVPEQRAPWARPGWRLRVRDWIAAEVERLGHAVAGVEQVKHWSISAVLRVETDGPQLYFKVPLRLPLFVDEAAVTHRLAARFGDHVPRPLAIQPERDWMLLPAFDEILTWDAPLDVHRETLRRFAELQRRSAAVTDELLADGCLDRRLDVLERQIEPLVHDAAAVAHLTREEVDELRRLAPAFQAHCRELARLGLPPTLVHGDLHLQNVARLGGSLVYFDWTDACVAHPFFDLHSLQWEQDERRSALLDAYLEPWREAASPDVLREVVALAAVVIPLHHAVSYQHIVGGLEPAAKWELDFAHEFLREALARARSLQDGP